jgi:hypothetical protein
MSALGQKRTSSYVRVMSALPPKGDIAERDGHVRFVPKGTFSTAAKLGQWSTILPFLAGTESA